MKPLLLSILFIGLSLPLFAGLSEDLHKAVQAGDLRKVKELVAQGADIQAKDRVGYTVLQKAADQKKWEIVKYLISKGADLDAKDRNDVSARLRLNWALSQALGAGNLTKMKKLVALGADVNHKWGSDPLLYHAFSDGRMDIVKYLLEKGANINAKSYLYRQTVLHVAARGGNLKMVKYLIKRGADLNAKDNFGRSVLHDAVHGGNLKIVNHLIDKGLDVNARAWRNGQTILAEAVTTGNLKLVKLLISKGADIHYAKIGKSNRTILHVAARTMALDIVKYLIKKGIDINAKDSAGYTALLVAADYGHKPEIVEYLIKKGADINAQDNEGYSALHITVFKRNIAIIKLLTNEGADVNIISKRGSTPLDLAETAEIRKLLRKHGARTRLRLKD
ncbi:MAG: ankyrin repeat domain-containing protein [Spirochaetota bacterium]|nr:ankyrin repeat domain-containing protein [Spirochaetota bacterium]